MKSDLQKLKDRLNAMLLETPVSSQEALYLSQEIDILIVEQYRNGPKTKRKTYVDSNLNLLAV